jgi:chromosome segregation ATPase
MNQQKGSLFMLAQQTGAACGLLAGSLRQLEKEIKDKDRRIQTLKARLEKLQSQPDPDPDHIEEIKADVQDLETQLETDRPMLKAFQEEYRSLCGPLPILN